MSSAPESFPVPAAANEASTHLDAVVEAIKQDSRITVDGATRPHPMLAMFTRGDHSIVLLPAIVWDRGRDILKPLASRLSDGTAMLVVLGHPQGVDAFTNKGLASIISAHPSPDELVVAMTRAFELLESRVSNATRGKSLDRYRVELGELLDIARSMTNERDVSKLLGVILEKSRFITGADAGSIYVVEGDDKRPMLRFKLTQNDSLTFDSREFVMPISTRSIAGAAAHSKKPINIANVYDMPPGSPYSFDKSFDEKIGYVSRSMLSMPLVSQRDEVIGVIQLINKKRDPSQKLLSREDVEEQVIPFDQRSEELLGMLSAQAAVSLENAMLYDEIQKLFEGFVRASVEAIESRDPTTSGHSRRVADLTVELAKVIDGSTDGVYADARFSREDLRELEYASLLHDFGKIGVREKVLVKAKKLFDEKLDIIRARFDFVVRTLEAEIFSRKVRVLERGGSRNELEALDKELSERRAELEASFDSILAANEPTVLQEGDFATIERLARDTYTDLRGNVRQLLDEEEVVSLSVQRGSLTPQEFDEIRSHVSHTFKFLSQIPWTKAFRRVPVIAGAHHERLNGTGYPNRLRAEEIPLQSKMMSISDIYDALTASDRPYKKAVPVDKALGILDFGVKDGHLEVELVRIFREARVWERVPPTP
jgi:HD-GYP domain-containing protein (c-di-GMP phosphodiesterase class II)